ncbi:MAG: LytTR family DNA-binding domain-containing protein [Bacteroidota bacterium]
MLHVLLFSMLVGGLSAIFRSQAYSIQSTITYAALEHGISALVIYVVALFFLSTDSTPENTLPKQKTESLWVYYRDEKIKLMLSEIIFVKSERPYLALITQDKKYLYSSSLKGFMEKWTTSDFVQIHKSTIINPSYITSFRSRKNGDYDFFLEGGHNVRASRHFKQQYGHLINSS